MSCTARTLFGWLLFSAVWGLIADYACGMVWFYVCSNYVLQAAVSWKLVFINCFLLTVGETLCSVCWRLRWQKADLRCFPDMQG